MSYTSPDEVLCVALLYVHVQYKIILFSVQVLCRGDDNIDIRQGIQLFILDILTNSKQMTKVTFVRSRISGIYHILFDGRRSTFVAYKDNGLWHAGLAYHFNLDTCGIDPLESIEFAASTLLEFKKALSLRCEYGFKQLALDSRQYQSFIDKRKTL